MANYTDLKTAIADYVKNRTGLETIDGVGLQQVLLSMVTSLGASYQFAGIATPGTNPGTPDQNVFWLAGPGTYANFGGTVVPAGSIGGFSWNGSWTYTVKTIIELVTGIDSDAEDKALAASVGKYLYQMMTTGAGGYQEKALTLNTDSYYTYNATTPPIMSTNPVSFEGVSCVKIRCNAGDKFKIFGKGTNTIRLYAFTNSSREVLETTGSTDTRTNGLEITAPAGSYWLYINFYQYYSTKDHLQEYVFVSQGLQAQIDAINIELALDYEFGGIVSPSFAPDSPTGRILYIAFEPGTYTNFGGTVLSDGQVGIFTYDGLSWHYNVNTVASVVDNFDSDSATKPISAKCGKELYEQINGVGVYQEKELTLISDSYYTYNATTPPIMSLNPVSFDGVYCVKIRCNEGDKFKIFGKGTSTIRLYNFTNSSREVLAGTSTIDVRNEGKIITAPAGAYWLYINFYQYDSTKDHLQERIITTQGLAAEIGNVSNETKTRDEYAAILPINVFGDIMPAQFKQKILALQDDVLVACVGDSITGRIQDCDAQEDAPHCPAGAQYKSWPFQLFYNVSKVKPLFDRLDSQRDGVDFFTKNGTWDAVSYSTIDSELNSDFKKEQSVAANTYRSNTIGAYVKFAFNADVYEKCNIIVSMYPNGADSQIVVEGGNGLMLASVDRVNWVEANGFAFSQNSNPNNYGSTYLQNNGISVSQRHRRIWMKKTGTATGTINIRYENTTEDMNKYLYCWGIERYSGPAIFFDNLGRGGRPTRYLAYNISDVFDRNPDFTIYEMPLANETSNAFNSLKEWYDTYFNGSGNNSYKVRSNNYQDVPILVLLPHGRAGFFDAENRAIMYSNQVAGDPVAYVYYKRMFNYVQGLIGTFENVVFVNLYDQLLNEAVGLGQTYVETFGSVSAYPGSLTADSIHLNQRGANRYNKYLSPLFEVSK